MSQLKEYVNQKELDRLASIYQRIESGIEALEEAELFLRDIPVGDYDSRKAKKA
jgi:GTP1/Obg family GTP-binding protein